QACCQETTPPNRAICTASNTTCSMPNQTCVTCGGAGQACCGDRVCTQQGFACGDGAICQQCGGAGQVCCAGRSCSGSGLACSDNLCAQCGGPGEPCCAGSMCSAGGCCDAGKNACVADGATCSSGGQCAASTCPPPAACGNGQAFSTFTKACTNSDSCSFGLHQLNCCGSQLA